MEKEQHEVEQDAQQAMEIWRGEVNTNLREITKTLAEVNAVIGRLPTRAEVEAMLAQRVHVDVFRTEIQAIHEDIAALKASPGKVRDWLSFGIGGGLGCLSLLISLLSLILFFLVAIHVIR
jgi:hypothetical protein